MTFAPAPLRSHMAPSPAEDASCNPWRALSAGIKRRIARIGAFALATLCLGASMAEAQTAHFSEAVSTLPASGLNFPSGVAVDGSGNVFVSDHGNNAVKEILAAGGYTNVLTLGSGFSGPFGVAVDGSGNVFVADFSNNAVKEILAAGGYTNVRTLGSGFNGPFGVAVDGSGNVFVADRYNNAIKEILAAGNYTNVLTLGSGFGSPAGVAVDGSGNVFVTESNSSAVKEILAAGNYTNVLTLGSGFSSPVGVAVDGGGNVFVADESNSAVKEILAAGGYTTVLTRGSGFKFPYGVTVDGDGNVLVADSNHNAVKKITTIQNVDFGSAAVGASAPGVIISLVFAFDTGGTIGAPLVLTQGVRGLDFRAQDGSSCTPQSYAAGASCTVNVRFTPTASGVRYGAVNLTDSSGNVLATAYIHGTGVGPQASFSPPAARVVANLGTANSGMAVDGGGNIIFSDTDSGTVKELVAAAGYAAINTLGTGCGCPEGAAVDGNGNIFVADVQAGTVKELVLTANGYAAAANTLGSGFSNPQGIAVDGNGNVFVADTGDNAVKEISAAGGYATILNLGSGFSGPQSLAVDESGNVFVADTGNHAVKEILAVGGYTTVQSIGSGFGSPTSVALDGNADVLVADQGNGTVVEIAAASGYTVVNTLVNVPNATRLAVDQNGSIFVLNAVSGEVSEFDYTHPAALHFASTAVGSTSSDSPQVVTVANSGNSPLTLEVPATGQNPALPAGFTLGTDSTCPVLASGASPAILAPGEACTASIRFIPTIAGPISGLLTFTDDALNAAAPLYVTQSIALDGTAIKPAPAITFAVPSHTFGDAPFSIAAASNSTGAFTYSVVAGPATIAGSTVTLTGTGTVVLQAAETADTNYAAATQNATFAVNGEVPTLSFAPIPTQTYGAAPFQVQAASTSTGTIVYTVASGPATVAGSTVTLTGAGTVTLSASQAAAGNYQAGAATTSFSVNPGFNLTTGMATASAAPGAAAVFSLNFAPMGAATYTDALSLGASGLPPGATATFSPASIAAGSAAVPVILTIQTAVSQTARNEQPFSGKSLVPLAIGLLLPIFGTCAAHKRFGRTLLVPAAAALSLGAVLGLIGCGGGNSHAAASQPAPSQTTASYTVAVTAADATTGLRNTVNVTLNVQ